jgi:hypothetical protein
MGLQHVIHLNDLRINREPIGHIAPIPCHQRQDSNNIIISAGRSGLRVLDPRVSPHADSPSPLQLTARELDHLGAHEEDRQGNKAKFQFPVKASVSPCASWIMVPSERLLFWRVSSGRQEKARVANGGFSGPITHALWVSNHKLITISLRREDQGANIQLWNVK